MLLWISIIALIKIMTLVIGFAKYRAFAYLHTYANKATGIVLFCFPFFYQLADLTVISIILCSIASLSALEELTININEKDLNRDVRGLFY